MGNQYTDNASENRCYSTNKTLLTSRSIRSNYAMPRDYRWKRGSHTQSNPIE